MARHLLILAGLILVGCHSNYSRAYDCPMVFIDGPSFVPGEPLVYTLRVDPSDRFGNLNYLWTIFSSAGEVQMVRGQGTTKIEVPWSTESITARVSIKGLPDHCASIISTSSQYDPAPVAEKIEEFSGQLSRADLRKVDEVLKAADKNSRVYIVISGPPRNPRETIRQKKKALFGRGYRLPHDFRITVVESPRNDDRIVIWIVPPGAAEPTS